MHWILSLYFFLLKSFLKFQVSTIFVSSENCFSFLSFIIEIYKFFQTITNFYKLFLSFAPFVLFVTILPQKGPKTFSMNKTITDDKIIKNQVKSTKKQRKEDVKKLNVCNILSRIACVSLRKQNICYDHIYLIIS